MNTNEITVLANGQVFVFGSNLKGHHAGGAAKTAYIKFGAEWGVGEGMTGQCYAFPTLDENMQPVSAFDLLRSKFRLYEACRQNPDKVFFLTKVGCGIAGFDEEDVKLIFADNVPVLNLIRPRNW